MADTKKQSKQATGKNNSNSVPKKSGKGSGEKKAQGKENKKNAQTKDVQAKKRTSKLGSAKSFLSGVLNELKKVHWPSRRESAIYTTVVVVTVGIVSVMIWIFDLILSTILRFIY